MLDKNLYNFIIENLESLEINGLKWSNPCIKKEQNEHTITTNIEGSEVNYEELD